MKFFCSLTITRKKIKALTRYPLLTNFQVTVILFHKTETSILTSTKDQKEMI